jgi:hypothetical protein
MNDQAAAVPGCRTARRADYTSMCALDQSATHCDRGRFLRRLFREQPEYTQVLQRDDQLVGFSTVRAGSGAWQVGPCIAEPAAGVEVLRHALGRLRGEAVLLDVPAGNLAAAELARDAGLHVQRRFVRMCRGPAADDDPQRLWASSGPELG